MSKFPIIPTTPPPLDINESEDEEEPDFRAFNVSLEEEKDIDFVIPDFTTDNETDGQTSSDLNDKIAYEETETNDEYDNKSNGNKSDPNSCDYDLDVQTLTEKDPTIVASNDHKSVETTINPNESHLDSNQNHLNAILNHHIIENESETGEPVVNIEEEEEQEFSDFSVVNQDEDDFEFADFTSYQSTECTDDIKPNQDFFDENQSLSFYKSDNSFGEFKDSNHRNSETINVSQNIDNNFNDNESDDDFADFASAQPVLNNDFQSVPDFKSDLFSDPIKSDENDDGFADFASFQDIEDVRPEDNAINYSNVNESEKLVQLFAQIFPSPESADFVENMPTISRDLFNSAEQNSKNLWKQLQDLESAPSLKLKWPTSRSFQLLLAALNIDPRNILRNSSVPMFASGLGYVLEPTKHKFNDDFSDDIECENTNGIISSTIPPVQFDWVSSGLTNPLDANQRSIVAFDLDFFVTNDDVKNTTKQTSISNFEELLSDGIDSNSLVFDKNKNNLVQQILSSVANTSSISMTQTKESQVLSAEALQVLDELPNLSFLRAKVLMFPINIKTNP